MSFNLKAYLRRINYQGSLSCDEQTLSALTQAHTQSIAFENIDVLLGKDIVLCPNKIFKKLVYKQRGGYCFELNILFQTVLKYLGFQIMPLGARVRLGVKSRCIMPARTHLFLKVTIGDRVWLTDVGFGSYSLLTALPLKHLAQRQVFQDVRRLENMSGRWFQQAKDKGRWFDLYEFDANLVMYESDQKVANWYTQTHSDTHFTSQLSVARALPNGGRAALRNNILRIVSNGGQDQLYEIKTAKQLATILEETFNLKVGRYVWQLWKRIC